MSSGAGNFSTTTYIMLLLFGGIGFIFIAYFVSILTRDMLSGYNNFTSTLATTQQQIVNKNITVMNVTYGNMTVEYLNTSYSKSQYVLATFSVFFANIFNDILSVVVLIGISIVLYALFEDKKKV